MPEILTPDRVLVRAGRRPKIVHIRRRMQCDHEDCRQHPDLAEACYRDARRVTFGLPAPDVRTLALCGIGSKATTREPLVEASRTFAAQWLIQLAKTIAKRAKDPDELPLVSWMVSPCICAHCLASWAGPSRREPTFTNNELVSMARGEA